VKHSIRNRMTFYYAAAATASAATLFLAGYMLLDSQLVSSLDDLNAAEFRQLKVRLGTDYRTLTPKIIDQRIRDSADAASALFYINVDEPSSGMVFYSRNLHNRSIPDVKGLHNYTVAMADVGEVRVGEFFLPPFDVTIATPMAPVHNSMRSYIEVSAALMLTMLCVSVLIGLWLSRVILRPLLFIRETANRISSDNLNERIPLPVHNDELTDLARLLNQMFARLENSFNQIKRFAAEASHELKTPLSLIRLHGERVLEDETLPPGIVDAVLVQLDEVARLNQIIDEMLFLSRAEANAIPLALEAAEPEQMLRNFEQDAIVLAEHNRSVFRLRCDGAGRVAFEERWLRQVWLNLLTNALNVSPEGATVSMHAQFAESRWLVTIEDEGPGLDDDKLSRIFDHFTQFGASARSGQGSGLGLAISRSIVLLHGGSITAENRADHSGLRVTVSLPAL
jgi:two-component system heavy metal sensor histidine kinase CusS